MYVISLKKTILSFVISLIALHYSISSQAAPAQIKVALVKKTQMENKLQLSGNIIAANTSKLAAEVDGIVSERFFEVGDSVSSESIIVKLRDKPARLSTDAAIANTKRAEASVQLATIDEKRLADLVKSRSTSVESHDSAKAKLAQSVAELDAAKAELARLQDQLQRHHISAPFDAVVTARYVEIGDWVESGNITYELVAIDKLHLEIPVPQQYYPDISAGNKVTVQIGQQQIASQIERVIPLAMANTRTFIIWVGLDNQQRQFIPGMSAKAEIELNTTNDPSLLVPRDALVRKADGEVIIWRLVESTPPSVESLPVKVGQAENDWVSVNSAKLLVGDQVVIRGNEALRPEQTVIIQP